MPVPGGIRLDEALESLRWIAGNATVLGAGFTGFVADAAQRRAGRRGSRPRSACRGTRSKIPQMARPRRASTSRSSTRERSRAGEEQAASEHLPAVRVALPRRRARGGTSAVCPQCGHHFPLRPPSGSPAHRPGLVRRGGRRAPLRRPARLLRPATVRRAAGRGRDEDRPGRCDRDRPAEIGGRPCQLAVMDFAFMGGSMGSVVGEKFARACESAAEPRRAARLRRPPRAARACRRGSSR